MEFKDAFNEKLDSYIKRYGCPPNRILVSADLYDTMRKEVEPMLTGQAPVSAPRLPLYRGVEVKRDFMLPPRSLIFVTPEMEQAPFVTEPRQ